MATTFRIPTVDMGSRDLANAAVYTCQAASSWLGWPMDKCAQDLLVYQEIIAAMKPDIIVETGSWRGGSGLFFASMCDLVGHGRVLSVDLRVPNPMPAHPRLMFFGGDSTTPATIKAVHAWAGRERGLVVLDSDHTAMHVNRELDAYADLVVPGGYLVVEDTNVNGHPVAPNFGPGPFEAVAEWLTRWPTFSVDFDIEPFITFAPGGYLRRAE